MASQLHEQTKEVLRQLYPLVPIREEYPIKANGHTLFIDLFVDEPFCIAVECQGRQHNEFVAHFHRDYYGYFNYKKRDRLKEEWCLKHGIPLAYVYESDDITPQLLEQRIADAQVVVEEHQE